VTTDGFTRSLPPVLAYEGGKVDNPKDPGGGTNQGVIQRVYDAWRAARNQPLQDVYLMAPAERDAIYRSQYWDAVQGDKLPAGVDFVVFDGAVNSGPKQSIKWLQRALGVRADGVLGAVTLGMLTNATDYDQLIDAIIDRRESFLEALSTFKTFGRGWLARTAKVRALGKSWASPQSVSPPIPVTPTEITPKADVNDASQTHGKPVADAAVGAGAGSATLGGTLQTLQDQLTPFSMAGGWISKLVVILIVGGGILAVGGLAYRFWASHRKARIADATDTQVIQ
jgi:lysozyme family protein